MDTPFCRLVKLAMDIFDKHMPTPNQVWYLTHLCVCFYKTMAIWLRTYFTTLYVNVRGNNEPFVAYNVC